MRDSDKQAPIDESLKEALGSQIKSTAFWSTVSAIVGVVAILAGGILYLTMSGIESFSLAVLIIGAALLLGAIVSSPRTVAMFIVGRQARFGAITLVMTIAFLAVAVGVNFLVFKNNHRFDVTATRFFTLAPQTTQILENLEVRIRANAFYVEDSILREAVEDILNEFSRKGDNFEYRFVDPELKRAIALNYNVTQFPAVVVENLETGIFQTVLLPAANSSIVAFNKLPSEQALVEGILVVTGEERKRIYFLTGHKERPATRDRQLGTTETNGLDLALEGMQRDNYDVKALNLQQIGSVPSDAAAVVIAGPKQDLTPEEYLALDEYLSRGGNMVVLLDPGSPPSFSALLGEWGIIAADVNLADGGSSVADQLLTPLVQRQNGQYAPVGSYGYEITLPINVTFFPGATALAATHRMEDRPPQTSFEPLLWTSQISWIEGNVDQPGFDPGTEIMTQYAIAAMVVACAKVSAPPTSCTSATPTTKIVAFGDSDFASNEFFTSRDNGDLFLNSVLFVTDDVELISIRPRIEITRDLILTSNENDFIRWSSWILPPALLLLLGTYVWWRRR